MAECDFHAERGEQAPAEVRVVVECPEHNRIQHLCGTCVEIYSDAIQAIIGPVDPRDVPDAHRSRTLNRWLPKVDWESIDNLVTDCWPWDAGTFESGYGSFRYGGHTAGYAHRYAFEWCYGIDAPVQEDEYEIMHECNTKKCVNPSHLWVGTAQQNQNHAAKCGAYEQKLSAEVAKEICDRYETEDITQEELADEYDVHQTNISQIVRGDAYGYV